MVGVWLAGLPACRERFWVEDDLEALRRIREAGRNRMNRFRGVSAAVSQSKPPSAPEPVSGNSISEVLSEQAARSESRSRSGFVGATKKNQVEDVVAYYVSKRPKRRPGLKERAKVEQRLKEGFTVEQLKEAIDGCLARPFTNDAGKTFDGLELICRDSAKVEQFRAAPKTAIPKPHETPYGQGVSRTELPTGGSKPYSPWGG